MRNSLSIISHQPAVYTPLNAQNRLASSGVAFCQNVKKLFNCFRKDLSKPPSVIAIPNRPVFVFECAPPGHYCKGSETDSGRPGQTARRDSLVNVLSETTSVRVSDQRKPRALNLANKEVEQAWRQLEVQEDASALDLIRGDENSIDADFDKPLDQIMALLDEIRPPAFEVEFIPRPNY